MLEREEKLQKYDQIVNATLTNIYSLSRPKSRIILSDFDEKDKNHLFVLAVALAAKDFFNFPLYIDGSLYQCYKINKLLKKRGIKIRKASKRKLGEINGISVSGLLDFERVYINQWLDKDSDYSDIYDEYYKGDFENG